jgi:hypothetical protein
VPAESTGSAPSAPPTAALRWSLCSACPAALCDRCYPSATAAPCDEGASASGRQEQPSTPPSSGAGSVWLCPSCEAGRAVSYGGLPWCALCSNSLAAHPNAECLPSTFCFASFPSGFAEATAAAAEAKHMHGDPIAAARASFGGIAHGQSLWQEAVRCSDCRRSWHGSCASKAGVAVLQPTGALSGGGESSSSASADAGGAQQQQQQQQQGAAMYLCRSCIRVRLPLGLADAGTGMYLKGGGAVGGVDFRSGSASAKGAGATLSVARPGTIAAPDSLFHVNAATREMVLRSTLP